MRSQWWNHLCHVSFLCSPLRQNSSQNRFNFESNWNKTAGHHRDIFSPPSFFKMPFRRTKLFFEKKLFTANLHLFKILKVYVFPKTLNFDEKRLLFEIIPSYTLSTGKLPPFLDFKKMAILTELYYFICILQQNCCTLVIKKIKFRIVQFCEIVQLASKGKKRTRGEKIFLHITNTLEKIDF